MLDADLTPRSVTSTCTAIDMQISLPAALVRLHCLLASPLCSAGFAPAVRAAGAVPKALGGGVTGFSPPMIYREGGKIVGVEADFAAALGRELARPVKFVEVKWDEQ